MRYTIEDLIKVYAEYNKMGIKEATELYKNRLIGKHDLLEAYLEYEGILGYTSSIWSIFEALMGNN